VPCCNARLALHTLTYIFIGFDAEPIYADNDFRVYHNILLADRVWAHLDCASTSRQGASLVSNASVLSPQSVAIMLNSVS